MAAPLFNTAPRPGESNISYGLRAFPQTLANSVTQPFRPGGRLNILNGMFDPNVPGSVPNQGLGVIAQLFGLNGTQEAKQELDKSVSYALAPATGPVAPFKAPAAPANAKPAAPPVSQYPFAIPAGALVTSGYRTPEHNKHVGGVANSYHTRKDQYGRPEAVDLVPGHGQSMTGLFAAAKQANPDADVINEGDHVHIEPNKQGGGMLGAFAQAANAVGLTTPPPAPNMSGYQNADALLQQAQGNVMKPFSATYQTTPMPELPKPDLLQAPDYSAGDAAFASAQPKNPFGGTPEEVSKNQLKMRRMDYFAGMAEALGSIDWSRGVGLGELFAKIGAGALQGAKFGDKEVEQKMDKFDAAMQQYQLAVAQRDDTKARDAANIANQNITSLNQYKRDLWTTNVQEWQKFEPQVIDGVLVTKTKLPGGQVQETHTPLDPAKQAAALYARANNQIAAANAQNEYGYKVWSANRELSGAALGYAMSDAMGQNNLQGRDGIAAFGLGEAANALAETGQWDGVIDRFNPGTDEAGRTRSQQISDEAARQAGIQPGKAPSEAQQSMMKAYISTQIISDMVNSGHAWALVGGWGKNQQKGAMKMNPAPEVTTSIIQQREADRKVTTRTDAKGRTTTTATGDSSISPENLARYGYSRY